MRTVFEEIGCSPCAARAMVEDEGNDTLDDLCFSRMGMLRHYARMSNALKVQLGEIKGEPNQDTWSAKRLR